MTELHYEDLELETINPEFGIEQEEDSLDKETLDQLEDMFW